MSMPVDTSLAGIWQTLGGLAMVMGLMALAAWSLKRWQPFKSRGDGVVKILANVNVGVHERIVVVDVEDRRLVVGVTPGRMDVLANLPKTTQPATESEPAPAEFRCSLDKNPRTRRDGG